MCDTISHQDFNMEAIREFLTQEFLTEFRLSEEDGVVVEQILRRFVIFKAKKEIQEVEKTPGPPPPKKRRLGPQESVISITAMPITTPQPSTSSAQNPQVGLGDEFNFLDGLVNFQADPQIASQPPTQPPEQPSFQPQSPAQPSFQPQSPAQPSFQPPAQPSFQPPAQPSFQPPAQPSFQPPAQSQPTSILCNICFTPFTDLEELIIHLRAGECGEEGDMVKETYCTPCKRTIKCQWKYMELHNIQQHGPPLKKKVGGRPKKT